MRIKKLRGSSDITTTKLEIKVHVLVSFSLDSIHLKLKSGKVFTLLYKRHLFSFWCIRVQEGQLTHSVKSPTAGSSLLGRDAVSVLSANLTNMAHRVLDLTSFGKEQENKKRQKNSSVSKYQLLNFNFIFGSWKDLNLATRAHDERCQCAVSRGRTP